MKEMEELYVVAENGQVEVNWEALELRTSSEFVAELKAWREVFPEDRLAAVNTLGKEFTFVTFVDKNDIVKQFMFDGIRNTFSSTSLTSEVIEFMVKALGGEVTWNKNK